jgi:hypothetical protein
MTKKVHLSSYMTETQFNNGYWYAVELKDFAIELGIPLASKLRKDEIEKSIKHFLRTGNILKPTKRNLTKTGVKDVKIGLSVKLPIINYTCNKETIQFIVSEANKIEPDLKEKSGVRYRLNRWREEQLTNGNKITYGDLVIKYIELNQKDGSFARIPSGRYINFLSDFLTNETNATRPEAVKAWKQLKKIDIPKTYKAWRKHKT